ncbi:MAG: DNA repair protein RecO [bacterium]
MATYKTRAISLKTAPFAEADKMVTLFTRENGKIKAIAKGARRVPSSLGGRVETLSYGEFFIVYGRSLDIISQCQMLESFQKVRESESCLPAALYMFKLVDAGTVVGQRYPELFDLLLENLIVLKDNCSGSLETTRKLARNFQAKFVRLEGIHQEGIDPGYVLSDHVGRDLQKW